jgi:hypothetical protein
VITKNTSVGVTKNIKYIVTVFSIFILQFIHINAQDSLYLIGTITGESLEKRITNVAGVGDVNGDGYGDLLIAMSEDNTVHLYFGSPDLTLEPDVVFTPRSSLSMISNFGLEIAGIGDVNGDGYADFAIAAHFHDWGVFKGIVFLYYGGETISTTPVAEFYEPWIQDGFGHLIVDVGDINKDGYNDFTISSSYNWTNGKGRVYLFWGGDTISFERSVTFLDTAAIDTLIDSFFGESVANIGDANGDGFDDIAISAGYDPSVLSEKVYVYYGGNQMDTTPDEILTSEIEDYSFGRVIKNAGDINKDGEIDFFIGSWGSAYLYLTVDSIITFNKSVTNIYAGFDLNNDGYYDFILANSQHKNSDSLMVGGAFVYLGGENVHTDYIHKLEGETKWSRFSDMISHVDINGDGYDELFILAPNYPNHENPSGKIYIYSYRNISNVKEYGEQLPGTFEVYQNYPNPFNPSTTIRYDTPEASRVSLVVYDKMGREVLRLVDDVIEPGYHTAEWGGRNSSGNRVSSGIYIYRFTARPLSVESTAEGLHYVKKMLFTK